MEVELRLDKFSGPLDLLLSLIHEEKLDITEISLSNVTEQFLRYLDTLEDRPASTGHGGRAEELADFLVIGARLLLLKSRLLLPQFALAEPEEEGTLEEQLRLYQRFVAAAKKLNKRWMTEDRAVFRVEPPRKSAGFVPPGNVTLPELYRQMVHLLERLTPPKVLLETHIDKAISLKQRIDDIRQLLKKAKHASFHGILRDAKNRTEIIVSFLAILELVKQKIVAVRQEEGFGDIVIERV